MATLSIKYRLQGKALPPRPLRAASRAAAAANTQAPADTKAERVPADGTWQCPVFVEGSSHGVELLYPYDTPCEVVNDGGEIRILWDPSGSPGDGVDADALTLSKASPTQTYLFNTMLDLQAPAGYVLRTEPHPRCLVDPAGTCPTALYGHVQSEWWPKHLLVGFQVPSAGRRHVFRKGEPYARVLFIPKDDYELVPMTPEEETGRRRMEVEIRLTQSLIGKDVRVGASGAHVNDHYEVLSRAYDRDGKGAVESIVRQALDRLSEVVPPGKTVQEYFRLAAQYQAQRRRVEARQVLQHVMRIAPDSAEALNRLAILEWDAGDREAAVAAIARATTVQPAAADFHFNLGEMLREMGRYGEAREAFEAALKLVPTDVNALTRLGLSIAQAGAIEEGLRYCRRAIDLHPSDPIPRVVIGMILAQHGRTGEARACYEAALLLDPRHVPARRMLDRLANGAPNAAAATATATATAAKQGQPTPTPASAGPS
jgi:Flp pilus assembly protein TadD